MNTPSCVVNPITGRAVKANGKIGKMILAEKSKPKTKPTDKPKVNTMYKDANAVRPNRADFEKKKELEKNKEPYTKYKNPIGVKIKDIPKILVKKNNKSIERGYKTIYNYKKDGSMSMSRLVDYEKSKVVDNDDWRDVLLTPEEIKKISNKGIKINLKKYLDNIDSYLKLNTKLEKEDIANFNALSPSIELLLNEMKLRKIEFDSWIEKDNIKRLNKYLKLKNKIEKTDYDL
jgi:hypothetical protein